MDAACGYAPGTAPKNESTRGEDSRPIVCVQLPAASSEGTSGASLDTFAVDGVRYILDKADEIARSRGCGRLPVVINFSYGTIAGRHDGTSDIERAIDELIGARQGTPAPVQVVMPAGNSRLKKCHAQVSFERGCSFFTRGSVKSLYWRVLPDDRTTSHLEILAAARGGGKPDQGQRQASLRRGQSPGEREFAPDSRMGGNGGRGPLRGSLLPRTGADVSRDVSNHAQADNAGGRPDATAKPRSGASRRMDDPTRERVVRA